MLQVENISKSFRKISDVLIDISFKVFPGSICGIFGSVEAGKSVLLNILSGRIDPDKGAIFFNGNNINNDSLYNSDEIIFIPEKVRLFPFMTGGRLLKYICRKKGVKDFIYHEYEKKYSDCFGKDVLDNYIITYSREKKRVLQIIMALIQKPHVLILDEPFKGISMRTEYICKDILSREKERGTIIIISSRYMGDREDFYSKILILKSGILLLDQDIHSINEYNEIRKKYEGKILK